eukprot:2882739-Prymnesium_polylepis.1
MAGVRELSNGLRAAQDRSSRADEFLPSHSRPNSFSTGRKASFTTGVRNMKQSFSAGRKMSREESRPLPIARSAGKSRSKLNDQGQDCAGLMGSMMGRGCAGAEEREMQNVAAVGASLM